jgi:tetratricopeptide (TPR) repeat protein
VRSRLAAGGVFCQWAHTYDISDGDLRSIVATFRSVFPDGTMWLAGDGDLLLVGSDAPLDPRLDAIATVWQRAGVREDLESVAVRDPFALLSLFVGGPAEMARYAADAAIQTDDWIALEFSAPAAVFAGVSATHAGELRALLDGGGPPRGGPYNGGPDDGRRPPAVARAIADASAAQWTERGAMMVGAEAFDSAYRYYATALELGASDTTTLDGFVRAAAATRREDEAERLLRTFMQSRRSDAAPRVALAQLFGMRGRFDEAVAIANEATRIAPADATAWEQLASLHADRGDAASLGRVADVLRRDFPQRASSWYFAASASFLKGDVDGALILVRRAIELDPNHADAYNLLGAVRGTAGDLGAAREAFQTSLRLDPRDVVTYINLAQLEMAAGQREAAADLFAEALSLDPNSKPAREGLAGAR